jgi:hypothetical protein
VHLKSILRETSLHTEVKGNNVLVHLQQRSNGWSGRSGSSSEDEYHLCLYVVDLGCMIRNPTWSETHGASSNTYTVAKAERAAKHRNVASYNASVGGSFRMYRHRHYPPEHSILD